jgi:hypothetical protein
VPQLAIPQFAPFEPDDGIYQDETAYHAQAVQAGTVVSAGVPITDLEYEDLLSQARELEGQSFNYSLFTEACIDLVERFYDETGHPGVFGDLFPENVRTGSLVWQRVPVTDRSLLSTWPEDVPYYTPPPTFMPDPPPYPAPRIFGNLPDPPALSDVADAQGEGHGQTRDAAYVTSFASVEQNALPGGPALDLNFGPARDLPDEAWATDAVLTFGDQLAHQRAEALPSVSLDAPDAQPMSPARTETAPAGNADGTSRQPEETAGGSSDGASLASVTHAVAPSDDAVSVGESREAMPASLTTLRDEGADTSS